MRALRRALPKKSSGILLARIVTRCARCVCALAKVAQFCAIVAFECADSASDKKKFSRPIGPIRRVVATAACEVTCVYGDERDASVLPTAHAYAMLARVPRNRARVLTDRIFAGFALGRARACMMSEAVIQFGIQDV